MTPEAAHGYPEYGCGGDHIGARRIRHSFRWSVAGCLVFFGILFVFADRPADHAEDLYRKSLIHEPESARVFLLNAIRECEQQDKPVRPKYLTALAEREVPESRTKRFSEAYALAPNDGFAAIRYGCSLYADGEYDEAVRLFDEAGQKASRNALPRYLKAAALLATFEADEASDSIDLQTTLGDSLAIIARTNNGDAPIEFPKPAWDASLPTDGYWYGDLRRQVVEESCAPLLRYHARAIELADESISQNEALYWDAWLETLQKMGERLMVCADTNAPMAAIGAEIQLQCIDRRKRLGKLVKGIVNEDLVEHQVRLDSAKEAIATFETQRSNQIHSRREQYQRQLRLVWRTGFFLIAVYIATYIIAKLFGNGRAAWCLRHHASFFYVVCAAPILLLGLLGLMSMALQTPSAPTGFLVLTTWAWWLVLSLVFIFGMTYPRIACVSPETAARRKTDRESGPEAPLTDDELGNARCARRRAVVSYWRRYFGAVVGLYAVMLCVWITAYRVLVGLLPWDLKLLVSGMYEQERAMLHEVVGALSWLSSMVR